MGVQNKKNIFLGIFTGLFLFILIAGGILVASQTDAITVDTGIGTTLGLGTADLESTVIKIIQWALGLVGLVGVVMMIYGGFVWMTAAGNEEKIARAKKILIRAGIGLVIVLLSWAIVMFIVNTINDATSPYPAHCTDGVLSGDETGVDCGGSCPACGGGSVFPPDTFTWSETQSSFAIPGDYATNVNRCSRLQPVFNHRIDGATFGSAFNTDNTGEIFIQESSELPATSNPENANPLSWNDFDPLPGQVEIVTSRNSITIKHDDKLFGTLVQAQNYRLWIPKSVTNGSGDPLGACNIAVGTCREGDNPHTGGTNDAYVWYFQVGTEVDNIDPYITSTEPISGGLPDRNVSRAPTFNINFNEAIDATTIDAGGYPYVTNFVLEQLDGQGGNVVATIDNTTDLGVAITSQGFSVSLINGAVLDSFTWYRITVSGIQDLCGNNMVVYPAWEFQTNDLVPGFGGQYPTGTDECPLASPVISATFNTTMYYNDVRIRLSTGGVTVTEANITASAVVPPNSYTMSGTNGQIQIEDPGPLSNIDNNFRAFNLYPATPLIPGTTYLVEVFTDKVMDINGTLLEGNWSFSVVTEDQCRCTPFISSISPQIGLQEQCITINGQCFQGTAAHPATAVLTFTDPVPPPNPPGPNNITPISSNYTDTIITTTIPPNFNMTDFIARPQVEITYTDVDYGIANTSNTSHQYQVNSSDVSNGACIWGVTPNSGYVGTGINISGIRFDPTSVLKDIVYNNPVTDTQSISSWSDTNALTTIPMTLLPMVNNIRIHNDAGFSNPYPFTVNPIPPDLPVVTNNYPSCTESCINTNISAVIFLDVTTSINNTTAKIYECGDSSCSFANGLALTGSNVSSGYFSPSTIISINPIANLAPDTFYRVVLTNGIQTAAGGVLTDLNFDDNDDGTIDAYSWIFKTKNDPNVCEIESVSINPITRTEPVNTNIIYNADARGSPNSCDLSGQILNPTDFNFNWLVTDPQSRAIAPAIIPSLPVNPGGNSATIRTVTSTNVYPVFVDIDAVNINSGRNAINSGQLDIIDCETDAHCQSNCPVAGNNSVCDLTTNKCTPWVEGFSPANGPAGTQVSINGCYFGNVAGNLNFGGTPAIFNCTNSWTDNLIIGKTDESLLLGSHTIDVITADGLSNVVDSGQLIQYPISDLCNGFSTPLTGLPGLCSVNPVAAKEGDWPITFYGNNLTTLNPTQTLARFSDGVGGFIDSTTGQGNNITYDDATVPINAMTGKAKIAVQSGSGYCESNEIDFGISCNTSSDCSTSCCDLVSNTCQPAGFCSTGGPGSICQLPANAPECQSGPLVTDNNYRCIDNSGNLDPTGINDYDLPPKPILTQGVAADVSCLTCCDPDVDNDGILNEPGDQQISAEGLTCVADQGSCSGNERGLYCGCDYTNLTIGDAQCGAQACGNDTCCYDRPTIVSAPYNSDCRNVALTMTFDREMDQSSFVLGSSVVVQQSGFVAGRIITNPTGFTFYPDQPFNTGTVTISVIENAVRSIKGVAMGTTSANSIQNYNINPGAEICQIKDINIEWFDQSAASFKASPSNITCAHDSCFGDYYVEQVPPESESAGFQQLWTATPVDQNGNILTGNIEMTWSDSNANGIFNISHDGLTNPLSPPLFLQTCPSPQIDLFNCLITSLNKDGRGEFSVTANGSTSNLRVDGNTIDLGTVTRKAQVNAMICNNPWPNAFAGDELPFEDSMALPKPDTITTANNFTTNFSTWYCRDQGLPALNSVINTVVHEEALPSIAGKDELLKEYYFLRAGTEDGIGIRMYENEGGKSAREWYFNYFGSAAPDPQDMLIDGYNAIRAGRTVYVSAWNIAGAALPGNNLYPQIYLISYNEGASEDTIKIYNELIKNWQFNINDNEANQAKLHRDMQRVNDLNDIYTSALQYKESNGTFPKLEGGTYINNLTSSGWPSWQSELGGNLGISMPIDPLNTFNGCPFDSKDTCWDEVNQNYSCPSGSSTYQYIVAPDGENADIFANLEYLRFIAPNTWLIGVAGEIDPCSANFPNAVCSCFNYTRSATGTITDRLGPQFDSVTVGGSPAPFNNVIGTQDVVVLLTDLAIPGPPSGVNRVEFYVDGQFKFTDTDSAVWSWSFNSNEYIDGNHTLLIRAYDNVGNWSENNYTLIVNNSGVINNPPFVDILSPADGETISGIVNLEGIASDDGAITLFRFDASDQDGNFNNCAVFTVAPSPSPSLYNTSGVTWNTTIDCNSDGIPDTPNGIYTLVAAATDNAGNTSTKTITVEVENFDITGPTVTIGDIPGICQAASWTCADASAGPICNRYDYCEASSSQCPRGNICDQSNPCLLPQPSICQREGIFDGTTNPYINIAVDDLNGIGDVQVYVDNIFRGNATYDTGNNWIWEWNTLEYGNGNHELKIFAYDEFNNLGSTTVTIPVDNELNDTIAPTVAFVTPPTPIYGVAVDGLLNIEVLANDNRGVNHVNFYVDYRRQFTDNNGGDGWIYPINTDILSDGWHSIQVEAVDSAGNRSESKEILVNVRGNGGPNILTPTVNPTTGGIGTDFCFFAEVTDTDGVISVEAILQDPDGTPIVDPSNPVPMVDLDANGPGNIYGGSWLSTITNTSFFVDILAEDSVGNISRYDNIPGVAGPCTPVPLPPVINPSLTASGVVGDPSFAYNISATNSPTSFNATGLPSGLSIDTVTGLISGTPAIGTEVGSPYSVTISATNADGTGTDTLVITITACNNNGVCDTGETTANCPADCPLLSPCDSTYGPTHVMGSWCDLPANCGDVVGPPRWECPAAIDTCTGPNINCCMIDQACF